MEAAIEAAASGYGPRLRRLDTKGEENALVKNPSPIPPCHTHLSCTAASCHAQHALLQEVEAAIEAAASECGLRLRRLDKKAEKNAIANARARLVALLEDEADPAVGGGAGCGGGWVFSRCES